MFRKKGNKYHKDENTDPKNGWIKEDGIRQGTRKEERELEKQIMQNGKDDRTKRQKRVTEKNVKEETTKEKTNQGHKEGYTKASKEIIKQSKKTEKWNIQKYLRCFVAR